MYGNNDEVQLPMDFQVAMLNKLSAPEFRRLLDEVFHNPAGGQPHYFFSNHDQPRQWDRYGDAVHNEQIARLMATLLMTTGATPQMYYGEEIGMRTTPPARIEDVKDPIGKIGWPEEKGRDGERTPMQWDDSKNAGFTKADHPWLRVPPSAAEVNVAAESRNPDSLLSFYKKLILLRRSEPALRDGKYIAVNTDDPSVLSYLRQNLRGDSALVVLNMSGQPQTLKYDLSQFGIRGEGAKTLVPSPGAEVSLNSMTLPPFGVFVGKVR
jgi:alpha-glucosidase